MMSKNEEDSVVATTLILKNNSNIQPVKICRGHTPEEYQDEDKVVIALMITGDCIADCVDCPHAVLMHMEESVMQMYDMIQKIYKDPEKAMKGISTIHLSRVEIPNSPEDME